jgi:hypothetical protein
MNFTMHDNRYEGEEKEHLHCQGEVFGKYLEKDCQLWRRLQLLVTPRAIRPGRAERPPKILGLETIDEVRAERRNAHSRVSG